MSVCVGVVCVCMCVCVCGVCVFVFVCVKLYMRGFVCGWVCAGMYGVSLRSSYNSLAHCKENTQTQSGNIRHTQE